MILTTILLTVAIIVIVTLRISMDISAKAMIEYLDMKGYDHPTKEELNLSFDIAAKKIKHREIINRQARRNV